MDLELRENEEILEKVKGDLWELVSQVRGTYTFTNKRVIFTPSVLLGTPRNTEFNYKDIVSIKKCLIGGLIPLLPFGVKVKTKQGKGHKLSLLNRKKWIEFMNERVNHL